MAVMDYATLQSTASTALGDASTSIQNALDREQLNAEVTQILTDLKVSILADKATVDAATAV